MFVILWIILFIIIIVLLLGLFVKVYIFVIDKGVIVIEKLFFFFFSFLEKGVVKLEFMVV